jgi:hypothetical protein
MPGDASERTLLLLQELAILKETKSTTAARRRREISQELKQIAAEKNSSDNGPS